MTQTDDTAKLASVRERALQGELSEKDVQQALKQHVKARPGSTLLKNEGTAKLIERERLRERGQTPAKSSDIAARAKNEDRWKYGSADWTPPDLTKPLPKQPTAALWNALERFVQIPDGGLEHFKSEHPTFLPHWFYGIRCGNDAEPKRKSGLLAWQAWHSLLRGAWHSGFHTEYAAQLVNIPTVPPGNKNFEVEPVCGAQRAVLAMMLESWRARFCPKCGLPFVARKPADKYWPKECFAEHRRERQRASKRYRRHKQAKALRRVKR